MFQEKKNNSAVYMNYAVYGGLIFNYDTHNYY